MDTNTLINLLKNHDWYYHYSDDHSKWLNGVQSEQAITDIYAISWQYRIRKAFIL